MNRSKSSWLISIDHPLWLKASIASGSTNPTKPAVTAPAATPVLDHAR